MCDWLVLESWLWELYVTMNFQGKRETTIVFWVLNYEIINF